MTKPEDRWLRWAKELGVPSVLLGLVLYLGYDAYREEKDREFMRTQLMQDKVIAALERQVELLQAILDECRGSK